MNTRHPGLNLGAHHGAADDAAEVEIFGFWVFMMSDAVLFGLLMATYVSFLGATHGGPGPQTLFDLRSITVQTVLLLTSSLTMGLAQLAMKHEEGTRRIVVWLLVSLGLGGAFLALEMHDFLSMIDKGGVPQASGFLSAYWALVPLHGLHVASAGLWMLAILGQMAWYGVDDGVKTGLLRLGVLWHFLDVVWIGIFTIVFVGGLA
ncbi:cytochrome c oxidase subunit 3 [Falsirhodobacter algicola]|uniref:Cytochrome o ubiquinol oxidase subunit III n=1 Tax=Falsirhodobacter algicola TaxID=2692330 RepID=A0A8J8MTM2_9RHOB|nr:cytochrome c oxidase subunit 3 [Falsirhodobacter algicola]QUS36455.1 cytochrome o ubiquinol oxidase subunit III [Falsirhodobacter algicola]